MILTFFYMVATWIQAWRLSSLKARLNMALQGPESFSPSIMFCMKQRVFDPKKDNSAAKDESDSNSITGDYLSSSLCNNYTVAKLGDLLWYQGDKRLCTIFPKQKVDVSEWLSYPIGKTQFPLYSHNFGQTFLHQDQKMHLLVEANLKYYSLAGSSKSVKLEDYGLLVAWIAIKKDFGLILETDLDHVTKFTTALMNGYCLINNGMLLRRIQSVSVFGSPCIYDNKINPIDDVKKLVGKDQRKACVQKLRVFSSTASLVSQGKIPLEIEKMPGIVILPGSRPLSLEATCEVAKDDEKSLPTVSNDNDAKSVSPVPSTPPPTPASATVSGVDGGNSTVASRAFMNNSASSTTLLDLQASPALTKYSEQSIDDSIASTSDIRGSEESILRIAPSSRASSCRDLGFDSTTYSPSMAVVQEYTGALTKPPNVLIYCDSENATINVRSVLEKTLESDRYTTYVLSKDEAESEVWTNEASLVVACGNVGGEVASQLINYLVKGGKLLALCSDALHTLLPHFKTAEVRENELVRFSYGKWKHVQMMHHIFCYQASPVKTRFSQDNEDGKPAIPTPAAPQTPASASVRDKMGKSHNFDVKVLGTEETWHTPSILLADLPESGGKAIFSQIHLEADPQQYEFEESKFKALKQSNATRLEIFSDLLSTHLQMSTRKVDFKQAAEEKVVHTPGFFLGRHELKLEMLERLKTRMNENDVLKLPKMEIQFSGRTTQTLSASAQFLPVMVHQCPDKFSTIEYFENLKTKEIGRLVIYVDVLPSSMNVVENCRLRHGFAIIARKQTQGKGRSKNSWIGPEGCAMFTVQLHVPQDSPLGGSRLPLLQHLVAIAMVSAVKRLPGYEGIDLRLKWPNDVYAGRGVKIGGLRVVTFVESSVTICNIGVGINLSNSKPTSCINDVIAHYNQSIGDKKKKLPLLTYEKYLALVFTELERLFNTIQETGNLDHLYRQYYNYWMHTDAEVTVVSSDGTSCEARVVGLDQFGFLQVENRQGKTFSVQPDGNSFNVLKGLIAPKF